jgi:hypothetical protein
LYGKVPWFHSPAIKIPISPGTEFAIAAFHAVKTWIWRADDNFDHRLEAIDAEGVLQEAREQWADHPALERLAYEAAERIANKWTGSGDISCEARGCAVDLIAHYARTQGIELIERDNEPAVT